MTLLADLLVILGLLFILAGVMGILRLPDVLLSKRGPLYPFPGSRFVDNYETPRLTVFSRGGLAPGLQNAVKSVAVHRFVRESLCALPVLDFGNQRHNRFGIPLVDVASRIYENPDKIVTTSRPPEHIVGFRYAPLLYCIGSECKLPQLRRKT